MSWTRPDDVRAQVRKLWDRGDILASLVTGEALFPLCLGLRAPSSAELSDRFDEVRTWIAELLAMPHCRIEMRAFRHRLLGANEVPDKACVDSLEDALALIGKRAEAAAFSALLDETRYRAPDLVAWLARRPLRALELSAAWSRLFDVVSWMRRHPRPGIFLRQADIPGVDTKFIEEHRGTLSDLLDLALPPDAIDRTASGRDGFARRYGFLEKPQRIRFRPLDARLALLPGGGRQDITLDADSFARLDPPVRRVFITENEVNYLAFPDVEGALLLFGSGYGWEALRDAAWLGRCRIQYWGDIDTHGFAILDQLRGLFPQVESFLMDRRTLEAFEPLWGFEERPAKHDLQRLNAEEQRLYDDLRRERIRPGLRLEQERVAFGWLARALSYES